MLFSASLCSPKFHEEAGCYWGTVSSRMQRVRCDESKTFFPVSLARLPSGCYLKFREPRASSEYLLPIFLITAIQPMSQSVLRDSLALSSRGFRLMIPANENGWQLKYNCLGLWQNTTWYHTDKRSIILKLFRQGPFIRWYNLPFSYTFRPSSHSLILIDIVLQPWQIYSVYLMFWILRLEI